MATLTCGLPVKDFCRIFIISVVTSLGLNAQDVESLANAERAFAQTSVDKDIKTAFLNAFDEHTLAFPNGLPQPGRKIWEDRPASNAYLFWWPVYADIASSGDFGWTTGPAVWGPDKSTKEAKGGGYYSSVWKKNAVGEWKVVADMGSAIYNPSDNLKTFTSSSTPSKVSKKDIPQIKQLDVTYDDLLNKNKISFDPTKFSDEGRIHRRGVPPVIGKTSIKSLQENDKFVFEHVGGEVASSNDMAFTYGTVKVTSMKDGKEVMTPLCYMRVWKLEGKDWKIAFDVIGG